MTDTASPTQVPDLTTGLPLRLPPKLRAAVDAAIRTAVDERWAARVWDRDTTVWTDDPHVAALIANRLGWLDAPEAFSDRVDELNAFAASAVAEGFKAGLVCGMGGSSLAPAVLAHALPRAAHGIPVAVLDSTDPAAVAAATTASDPSETLYLIASKSGTTTESLDFLAYFWDVEHHLHGRGPEAAPGEHFVAITDPGNLQHFPHSEAFRSVFLNQADIGGRYSALTYVGLVPAALLGLDLDGLLGDARAMAERCRADDATNPGVWLGASLAALARAGCDKLTFVIEPRLAPLGAWLEQLIAESTGKRGVGIVPVDGEPLGVPSVYGHDRVFVRLGRTAPSDWRTSTDTALEALAAADHPVIDLGLEAGAWLGGEFFRWEFATAIAGAGLHIDPFDEPNVTESKDNTRRVLKGFHDDGSLPVATPLASEGHLRLFGDAPLRLTEPVADVAGELRRHLDRTRANGYIAIQAFIAPTPAREAALRDLQRILRDATHHAVTLGFGPRYLHSTGQLHKGGAPLGCFLQLVAGHPDDVAIPGREETFGVLIDAQELGDFASLEAHELPVLRIDLSEDADRGLAELRTVVDRALA